ncbi:3-hydroxyacyl-[acyl-carrier-protein] dehydratase FabZ [Pseudobythopirellula maris]|uniref:3-hydroxyacyl-[acyl-carrier-protein] dehydratase FabZ n=1 Tax=Pseudobythopirellula maris TaxID=2527991 RepID=A0A5C5ZTN6_9BACT|nr:3-hydroxyacyl-ACP dehydratase FabZ family protein [Pseudobythopirellula maris]TWT90610.1 3-hydroxyacyl-[acyl-carrier-protein] dehydratase FabZ [Pseudobythopirellula maris]
MSLEAIKAAIPHREPFLLIDEVVEQGESSITCRKRFTGEEFWYAGHYPDFPITPGVILCEASMQAGAVLLSGMVEDADGKVPVATRANNVQFRDMVQPGDTVRIEVELTERLSEAFFMKAKVTNETRGKLACRFDFACTLAAKT